jgi:hypothetical protein
LHETCRKLARGELIEQIADLSIFFVCLRNLSDVIAYIISVRLRIGDCKWE